MTLPYALAREIEDRYVGSIIFFKDKPIYVESVDRLYILFRSLAPNSAIQSAPISAPEFKDGPFQLGYVNGILSPSYDEDGNRVEQSLKMARYCSRVPVRQWKQGLTLGNMIFTPTRPAFNWGKITHSPGFRDMLLGEYPSLASAIKSLGEEIASVAFHRRLAVSLNELEEIQLHHRGSLIAVSDDGKKFRVGKPYVYFKEWLATQEVKTW